MYRKQQRCWFSLRREDQQCCWRQTADLSNGVICTTLDIQHTSTTFDLLCLSIQVYIYTSEVEKPVSTIKSLVLPIQQPNLLFQQLKRKCEKLLWIANRNKQGKF